MARETVNFGPNSKGITGFVDGKKLTLEIDMTGDFGPSSTGKTTIVATTAGGVRVKDVIVGVNVNRKVKQ